MTESQTIDIKTTTREEMIDVTALVRGAVRKAGVERGIVLVFCPHTTAGLTVQENSDPTVRQDMLAHMRKLVPKDAGFQHAEDNSDAHIKSSLTGVSVHLVVEGGRPVLGHWQALYFCEYDGPRDRRLVVKVVAG
jgi:secondary thiamine-phosphate synthase enzyme